jgi:hypothetical protein
VARPEKDKPLSTSALHFPAQHIDQTDIKLFNDMPFSDESIEKYSNSGPINIDLQKEASRTLTAELNTRNSRQPAHQFD